MASSSGKANTSKISAVSLAIDGDTILDRSIFKDDKLLRMSLKDLSRSISRTTSSILTISVYLQWMDVHRQNPSQLTEHWSNTLIHWVESLRARGIEEHRLSAQVKTWLEVNSPFTIVNKRYPPNPDDIKHAFAEVITKLMSATSKFDQHCEQNPRELKGERSQGRERELAGDQDRGRRKDRQNEQHKSRSGSLEVHCGATTSESGSDQGVSKPVKKQLIIPDQFLGPPPIKYVCNRCGKKGHHLQACPTNLDPSYDTPPDDNYVCTCCGARGEHYRSYCSKNADPNSINERRKALGISTSRELYLEDFNSQQEFDRMRKRKRNQDHEAEGSSVYLKSERIRKLNKPNKIEAGRLLSFNEEGAVVDNAKPTTSRASHYVSSGIKKLSLGSETRSAAPRTSRNLRKAVDHSEVAKSRFEHESACRKPSRREERQASMQTSHDATSDKIKISDKLEPLDQTEGSIITSRNNNTRRQSPSASSAEILATQAVENKPVEKYCTFVLKLMGKYPAMKEIVNKVKKRPTTVDLAEKDCERQYKQELKASRNISLTDDQSEQADGDQKSIIQMPSSQELQSLEDYETQAFPQLDGTCDESVVEEHEAFPRRCHKKNEFRNRRFRSISDIAKEISSFKSSKSNLSVIECSSRGSRPNLVASPQERILCEKSPNRRLVPAITSALKLTTANFEGTNIQEDRRRLLRPETPQYSLSGSETCKAEATFQFSEKSPISPSFPFDKANKLTPDSSTETFETVEIILEGAKERAFNPYQFRALQKRGGSSETPSRTPTTFRHIVRRLLAQDHIANDYRHFSDGLGLAGIAEITTNLPSIRTGEMGRPGSPGFHGQSGLDELFPKEPQTVVQHQQGAVAQEKMEVNHVKFRRSGEKNAVVASCVEVVRKKDTIAQLKDFARSFKLQSPMPEDIAKIMRIESRDEAQEKVEGKSEESSPEVI